MEARTAWTDQRLDDFAESLKALPVEVGKIREAVERLTDEARAMREETRALRPDLSSSQRQIAQIGWALAAALLTALIALVIAVA